MPNHMHGIIEIMDEDPSDPKQSLLNQVMPEDIAERHPHRDQIITWAKDRMQINPHYTITAPIIPRTPSRVGAALRGRPDQNDHSGDAIRGGHGGPPLPSPTVGDLMNQFKSITTHEYMAGVKQQGWKRFDGRLWQRGFWDSIIWTERDLAHVREYINDNPRNWMRDSEYRA